jgi:hypothetical protein
VKRKGESKKDRKDKNSSVSPAFPVFLFFRKKEKKRREKSELPLAIEPRVKPPSPKVRPTTKGGGC